MNQQLNIASNKPAYKNAGEDFKILPQTIVKTCKHRNTAGFCIRSNRQCPATLFNITLNK